MIVHLTECPDPSCRQIAEVVDDWEQDTTDGPVRYWTVECFWGHKYGPVEPY